MNITHLFGIYYPPESEKFGSVEISDATPAQVQERIGVLRESIGKMEAAKIERSPKHKPQTLDRFIKSLGEEIVQLEQLSSNSENSEERSLPPEASP